MSALAGHFKNRLLGLLCQILGTTKKAKFRNCCDLATLSFMVCYWPALLFIGFGAMEVTKPYKFIGFGAT
jgi:hypothetical protein